MQSKIHQQTVVVTGSNGFVGLQIVKSFLEQNYKVKAAVRNCNNQEKIKDLQQLPLGSENLDIVSIDLMDEQSLYEVFINADIVIHGASPLQTENPEQEESFVKPAVNGTENVIKAVLKNSKTIKNFIFISSILNVAQFANKKSVKYTSKDWADVEHYRSSKNYLCLSKYLAERKFHDYKLYLKNNGIKATVICPSLVLGPIISQTHQSLSTQMIYDYVSGPKEVIPIQNIAITDVRDVADMCCQIIKKQCEGRYLCTLDKGFSYQYIVNTAQKYAPKEVAEKIKTKLAEGDPKACKIWLFDNKPSSKILGRSFKTSDDTIQETVKSWVEHKQI